MDEAPHKLPFAQLRGFFMRQPRLSPLETSNAKHIVVLLLYMGLAMFLPMTMLLRAGHSTLLIEAMPILVLIAFLVLAMATDHFERSLRDRVLVVVGAVAWYFVFGLPFAELMFLELPRVLHMDMGTPASSLLNGRALAGIGSLTAATSASRWMLKSPRRSLDIQFV